MRRFIRYLTDYLRNSSRPALLLTTLLVAALIYANYSVGIERRIQALPWYAAIGAFFAFFSLVLALVWGLQYEWGYKERAGTTTPTLRRGHIEVTTSVAPLGYFQPKMLLLLALAALFFSLKMVHWDLGPLLPNTLHFPWDRYTLLVIQLPLKLLLLFTFLFACRKFGLLEGNSIAAGTGLTRRNFDAAPYFALLLLLLPLIALASTQHDFLQVYPKVQHLSFIDGFAHPAWPWKLLYELSYGLDFLGIELFFRGLLVIGLLRFVGQDASASSDLLRTSPDLLRHGPSRSGPSLGPRPHRSGPSLDSVLPMAAFYCTIHFGKPLGECISSFFGGLILGVLAANNRTILGGLIVHLGLAWLMEIGGWLGHLYFH
jgi:hypothetical protein